MPSDLTAPTLAAPATEIPLPHTPSLLIRLALSDLRKVEGLPEKYQVDMGVWHEPVEGACLVCLAGSVMAQTLAIPDSRPLFPSHFNKHNRSALFALDCFRSAYLCGDMIQACDQLSARPIPWTREIPYYDEDPAGFHAALHALADAFEADGQ